MNFFVVENLQLPTKHLVTSTNLLYNLDYYFKDVLINIIIFYNYKSQKGHSPGYSCLILVYTFIYESQKLSVVASC